MDSFDKSYIWQLGDWPEWRFDLAALTGALGQVSRAQGHLQGRLADVGMVPRDLAELGALALEVQGTSAIEGEALAAHSVRSSLARRLGVNIGALAPIDRSVEGVVDMVLDATSRCDTPLTAERLFSWHAALFPSGYSGMQRILIAQWRDDSNGAMQVVSGAIGRQTVHFEAPAAVQLPMEAARFLHWFNLPEQAATTGTVPLPDLIKAGIAHLWFVTLHPFDDGNGRIARAIGEMALARADAQSAPTAQRFYSLSAQIQRERGDYYTALERTQKGSLDITPWLHWFLGCLLRAVEGAQSTVDQVLRKARFWQQLSGSTLNQRQIKLLNRLLDGFEGKLTSSKWATIAKCSPDTALRDISELLAIGALRKSTSGGRSTAYELNA